MRNTRWYLLLTAIGALFLFAGMTAAQHDQHIKVGKQGATTFKTTVKVGDLTLQPGRYTFKHRADGMDHFVSFTSPKGDVREVKCDVEPLGKKAPDTAIYLRDEQGVTRVARIVVAGENVAHVF